MCTCRGITGKDEMRQNGSQVRTYSVVAGRRGREGRLLRLGWRSLRGTWKEFGVELLTGVLLPGVWAEAILSPSGGCALMCVRVFGVLDVRGRYSRWDKMLTRRRQK